MKLLLPALMLLIIACNPSKKNQADLLVKNARVYTVDSDFTVAEAFVVTNGKIIAVGNSADLTTRYDAREVIDAHNRPVFPGFIDAHTHFYRYGQTLQQVNLAATRSWKQVVDSVIAFSKNNPESWLIGNGWDQNKWTKKQFPDKAKLDSAFPERPILLKRIDGHAIIVNQAALNIATIKPGQTIQGGEIETVKGKLTGILTDNAMKLVESKIPATDDDQIDTCLLDAQTNCFAAGLTTVDDCGLDYTMIDKIKRLQNQGKLKMRMYVMLSDKPDNYAYAFRTGIIKTPLLDVRAFKVYADGALGSRGACLLKPYTDRKNWRGLMLSDRRHFEDVAKQIAAIGFQMCTHAIGDSANRVILKVYAGVLKGKNDKRWRIEHAQVLAPADIKLFGKYSIIPSVQPTHATSDMRWASQRIGKQRLQTAYAYKQLLDQNGWIPLGTDFPVENISPLYTFYAAVTRKDLQGWPPHGFQTKNALSRKQALMGMTIWAAKANFEEIEKGSIEVGKYADFVILDKDIMTIGTKEVPGVKVLNTYVNGEKVFSRGQN